MNNGRRRKEVLFLMVMTALGGEARKKKGYEILKVRGPFIAMIQLESKLSAMLGEATKQKELYRVKEVVNGFVPAGFLLLAPELKLWFATQVVKRLVGSGWTPPKDNDAILFIQEMYDLAGNINLTTPPGQALTDAAVHSVDKLRSKYGMFV